MDDATRRRRLDDLRTIPLLAGLSDDSLGRVLETATEFEAAAGHVLVQPNQPGAGLFVIEEGRVAVDVPGRRIELEAGDFFGDLALLDERAVHVARVSALTPVRCLAISRADFDELLASEPKMAVAMLKALARRLAATSTR